MGSTFGKNIKISVAGQSHSSAMGVIIDGIPAGTKIDLDALYGFLERRAPGKNRFSTQRKESDIPKILSGVVDGVCCGAPLLAIIENTNQRPSDYSQFADIPRPSHADYCATKKYFGNADISGGGHFSGRLTAPLCIAGGICKQILAAYGIEIFAHVSEIHGVKAVSPDYGKITAQDLSRILNREIPTADEEACKKMADEIDKARLEGDSVGGIIECAVLGMPVGVGDPIFERIECAVSSAVFAIPAVRGIEFGNGFGSAALYGSENNDPFYIGEDGRVHTETNNQGGMLGGISTGEPIVFRVAVKPTPSIAKQQKSVSLSENENKVLKIEGRHDPCIVPRAVPVVEAAAAIALLDLYLDRTKELYMKGEN